MRYAWNLANGNGLVWNAGERVEGYSNLLMTLVMTVSNLLFDKPFASLSIQISGMILLLLLAFLAIKISERLLRADLESYKGLVYALITLGVLGYYPLVYWSLMGMETGLLTLLLLVAALFTLRYIDERNNLQLYLGAASLGLAFLTRNDSAIFAITIFGYLLLTTIKSDDFFNSIKPIIPAALIFTAFVIFQLAFRYFYYGQLLPNTYLLKVTGFPIELRIMNGIGFLRPFFRETMLLIFLASLSLITHFNLRRAFLLSFLILAILYQIWNGGDPWRIWRIISPGVPFIIILATIAVLEIGTSYTIRGKIPKIEVLISRKLSVGRAILMILVILTALFFVNQRFIREIAGFRRPFQVISNRDNVRTALAISDLTTEDSTVGVFWAGAIPYYSERRAIDFLGKSDYYIASLSPDLSGKTGWNGMLSVPGHNKYDLTYSIQELKPTFIQGYEWGSQDLSQWVTMNYQKIDINDVELYLLIDSDQVNWSKISGD